MNEHNPGKDEIMFLRPYSKCQISNTQIYGLSTGNNSSFHIFCNSALFALVVNKKTH